MAATKLQMNWSSVTWLSTPITKITAGGFGQGGQLLKFSGDGDVYPTVIVNNMNEPHASFTTGDVGNAMLLVPGTLGTLVATLADAKAAVSGSVVFTVTTLAVFENCDTSAAHAQYGTATLTWQFLSTDGSTSPVVISRA
jgi:hypothetical protein